MAKSPNCASHRVSAVGSALVYGMGGFLVIRGAFTIGTMVAFGAYLSSLYGTLSGLANAPVEFATSIVSFERVFEVIDLPLEIADALAAEVLNMPCAAAAAATDAPSSRARAATASAGKRVKSARLARKASKPADVAFTEFKRPPDRGNAFRVVYLFPVIEIRHPHTSQTQCRNLRIAMDFDVLAGNLPPNTSGVDAHTNHNRIRDLIVLPPPRPFQVASNPSRPFVSQLLPCFPPDSPVRRVEPLDQIIVLDR